MKFNVHMQCPHCGWENYTLVEEISYHPEVIICDEEAGGCGEPFAFEVQFEPKVTTYTLEKHEEHD